MHAVPTLEPRLQAVADCISADVHADIGSDHAHLPLYLLATSKVQRVIAIEKARAPFERSVRALRGWPASVRLGNGLEPLNAKEVASLSICGMGAFTIIKILAAQPDKQPPHMVLQANDKPEELRRWAYQYGYHINAEQMVAGFWRYVVLSLRRGEGRDPAYEGMGLELALMFGPQLLAQRHPLLYEELLSQQEKYEKLGASKNPLIPHRLNLIREALVYYD